MKLLINSHGYNSGISYHRIQPILKTKVDFAVYDLWEDTKKITLKDYDYVIFNGAICPKEPDRAFEEVKSAGLKIVVDVDDYWELPPHHPMRFHGDTAYIKWQTQIKSNIQKADIVWCTTIELCDHVKSLNPSADVWLVRNAIDYTEDQWLSSRSHFVNNKKINIGYIGGRTHYKDLNPLLSPMATIWSRHKDRIYVNVMGVSQNSKDSIRCWNNIWNNVTLNGKYRKEQYSKGYSLVTSNSYGYYYDMNDIVLASVLDNEFNRCKSELKVLEAGAKWKPIVCTDIVTYNRVGLTGLKTASTSDEWIHHIESLFDKQIRKDYGKLLGQYVRDEYRIEKENQVRLNSLS